MRVLNFIRVIRIFRLAQSVRGLRLLKIVGSLNRGMRSIRSTFKRRGFSYVVLLTIIVTFVGAAGMLAFEHGTLGSKGFQNYGDALWWTSMIMTTLGSEAWPQTPEGRILAFILALYAFGVFGYVTATLATYFVGREAEDKSSEIASASEIKELSNKINELKLAIGKLTDKNKSE